MSQLQTFSATSQKPLENTVLDNHPRIKETLWEVSQREVSATTGAHTHTKKNTSSDALESLNAYEEQFSFIHITLLTRQHSSVPKEIFLSPKFLLLKKVTVCEWVPEFLQLCRMLPYLSHLIQNMMSLLNYWGMGRAWKSSRQDSQRALKSCRSK